MAITRSLTVMFPPTNFRLRKPEKVETAIVSTIFCTSGFFAVDIAEFPALGYCSNATNLPVTYAYDYGKWPEGACQPGILCWYWTPKYSGRFHRLIIVYLARLLSRGQGSTSLMVGGLYFSAAESLPSNTTHSYLQGPVLSPLAFDPLPLLRLFILHQIYQ